MDYTNAEILIMSRDSFCFYDHDSDPQPIWIETNREKKMRKANKQNHIVTYNRCGKIN